MQEILDTLLNTLGTHCAVAKALGYSERQYYNIRRKLDRGQDLHPRVQAVILMRSQTFCRGGGDFAVAFQPVGHSVQAASGQCHG